MFDEVRKNLFRLDEDTYLKKSESSWNIIYPIRKDMTKQHTWKNINWRNVFFPGGINYMGKIIFMIALVLFCVWAYQHDVAMCEEVLSDPCGYCYESGLINIYTTDDLTWGKEKSDVRDTGANT